MQWSKTITKLPTINFGILEGKHKKNYCNFWTFSPEFVFFLQKTPKKNDVILVLRVSKGRIGSRWTNNITWIFGAKIPALVVVAACCWPIVPFCVVVFFYLRDDVLAAGWSDFSMEGGFLWRCHCWLLCALVVQGQN